MPISDYIPSGTTAAVAAGGVAVVAVVYISSRSGENDPAPAGSNTRDTVCNQPSPELCAISWRRSA
jgi:hypothetical protein